MFCCTSQTRDAAQAEKRQTSQMNEARHHRTSLVLNPPQRAYIVDRPMSMHEQIYVEAPPSYTAAMQYASPPAMTYDEKTEKQALAASWETAREQHHSDRHGEVSDTSSVISTPSTQVSGLGSMYTGTTRREGAGRLSDEYSSRPPSYYARSIDRRSSTSSTSTTRITGHPVMRDGWFENLGRDSRSANNG
jgi:hypothetical protein